MVQSTQRVRVYEGVGPPPTNSGPPTKWGHLPLDTIQGGDLIEMTMDKEDLLEKLVRNLVFVSLTTG